MAYFKRMKLESNFEDWLEDKITRLKSEGVIKSQTDDTENSQHDSEPEELPPWQPLNLTSNMADRRVGPKGQRNADTTRYQHISTGAAGDYYRFVWENDEESSVFDRDEYTKGTQDKHFTTRTHALANVSRDSERRQANGRLSVLPVEDQEASLSRQAGIVLGIGRGDVAATYTKHQGSRRHPGGGDKELGEWTYHVMDDQRVPDPRFSITGHDEPSDVMPGVRDLGCSVVSARGLSDGGSRGPRVCDHTHRQHQDQETSHQVAGHALGNDLSPGGGTGAVFWRQSDSIPGGGNVYDMVEPSASTRSEYRSIKVHFRM